MLSLARKVTVPTPRCQEARAFTAGQEPTEYRYSTAAASSAYSRRLPTFSSSTSRTSAGLAKKNSFRELARFTVRSAK